MWVSKLGMAAEEHGHQGALDVQRQGIPPPPHRAGTGTGGGGGENTSSAFSPSSRKGCIAMSIHNADKSDPL